MLFKSAYKHGLNFEVFFLKTSEKNPQQQMPPCFDVTAPIFSNTWELWFWKVWSHEAINNPLSNSLTHTKQEMSTVKFHQHLKTAFIFPYVLITLTLPVFMWENDQCIKKIKIRARFMTQRSAILEAECDFGLSYLHNK